MKRILKNYTREGVNGSFRGQKIWFGPKQSQVFDMKDEEERAKYYYWKQTYEFIGDITFREDMKAVMNK